jgi:hypothetical protein
MFDREEINCSTQQGRIWRTHGKVGRTEKLRVVKTVRQSCPLLQIFDIDNFSRRIFYTKQLMENSYEQKQPQCPWLQGCQIVCFQTEKPNFYKFWSVLQWTMMVYFMDTWSNLRTFVIFYEHLVNWYIFSRFGIFFPLLVFCAKKWSGNPGTDVVIFKKYFRQKKLQKIGVFDPKQSLILKNFDHNIGFWEKRQFSRRKLVKIAENCDPNIDPCLVIDLSDFQERGLEAARTTEDEEPGRKFGSPAQAATPTEGRRCW